MGNGRYGYNDTVIRTTIIIMKNAVPAQHDSRYRYNQGEYIEV